MTTNKKVSIVIPTFNRAHSLKRAVKSSIEQTYHCEIIVCNHGSTDNTDEVMKQFKDQVLYIKREEDYGPHFCWLDGVISASGEFIHIQFDDDWIDPTFIEKCIGVMNDDTAFTFSSPLIFDEESKVYSKTDFNKWLPGSGIYRVKKYEKKLLKSLISPSAVIYRRADVIDALYQGKLPLSLSHYHGVGPDFFMTLLTMLRYKNFGFISEDLAFFSYHDGSISVDAMKDKNSSLQLRQSYREVRRYYSDLKLIKKWHYFSKLFKILYSIKDYIHFNLLNRK